jgi:hypoxanthine phosphoribosyltransferase
MAIINIHNKKFEPFILKQQIQKRIEDLAAEITAEFSAKKPLFIAVLNGSFMFAADLFKHIAFESEISFIKIASYHGMQSSQKVNQLIGLTEDISNRHIIIIEDIIDTGLTMKHILAELQSKQPQSVSVVSLLVKPSAIQFPLPIHYTGFEIDNQFVLGYGLDYDGLGRNLPEIYIEMENHNL